MKLLEFLMVDGNQSHFLQALHFAAVVYNISQAIECHPFCEFLLGFVDGCDHSETKTGTFIYFYFYHIITKSVIKKGCSHTDRMATPFPQDGYTLWGVWLHPSVFTLLLLFDIRLSATPFARQW